MILLIWLSYLIFRRKANDPICARLQREIYKLLFSFFVSLRVSGRVGTLYFC